MRIKGKWEREQRLAKQNENAVKGSAARQRIVTDTDEKTHPCSIDKNVTIKEHAVETNDRRPRR